MFLSPNCTPLLQPMNQNEIQYIKSQYKRNLLCSVIAMVKGEEGGKHKKGRPFAQEQAMPAIHQILSLKPQHILYGRPDYSCCIVVATSKHIMRQNQAIRSESLTNKEVIHSSKSKANGITPKISENVACDPKPSLPIPSKVAEQKIKSSLNLVLTPATDAGRPEVLALVTIVSHEPLTAVYYANIYSHLANGIIFWGNSSAANKPFSAQKRAIKALLNVSSRTPGCPLFQLKDSLDNDRTVKRKSVSFADSSSTLLAPSSLISENLHTQSCPVPTVSPLCSDCVRLSPASKELLTNEDVNRDNEFHTVVSRKRRQRSNSIVCKSLQPVNGISGVPRRATIYVGRISLETSSKDIKNFLADSSLNTPKVHESSSDQSTNGIRSSITESATTEQQLSEFPGASAGVSSVIQPNLASTRISTRSNSGSTKFLISCVYIPPKSSSEIYESHCQAVENILSTNSFAGVIILGDYNLPDLIWSDEPWNEVNFSNSNIAPQGLQQVNSIKNQNGVLLDLAFSNCYVKCNIITEYLLNCDVHHPARVHTVAQNKKRPSTAADAALASLHPLSSCILGHFSFSKPQLGSSSGFRPPAHSICRLGSLSRNS
ncbi:hypothetical protein J437_LFUL017333 [Ladona fulva]|uniref:Endonuclease/exonuclease/phosphatase domain-containing protein n=1 Tax=Ladona fulva TaxID=123851 RepID=A0A8K0KMF2_LADFU|nr:hypothetical protein J437_LFUL017333 [Ladona fulva]